jgi:hydroxypyruvate reductase
LRHDDARQIFHQALAAASIPAAFARRFPQTLPPHDRVYAIAVGKAALPMLDALPVALDGGVCCAPVLPENRRQGVEYYTGGHPLPNEDSFASARAALRLMHQTTARDLVFFLISGGGSAMFELPLDPRISLAETRALYQALVGSGATIAEINIVRKHFSAVKGGRLAAAGQAQRMSFLVSDVAPQYLDALASGPTLPDRSTVAECRKIVERYRLAERFPFLRNPGETPKLVDASVETLLSSEDLVEAARQCATALGYDLVVDNTCDDWDYADAAKYLLQRFAALRSEHRRLCLLSVGEVTVRLSADPGSGGRNQQFALACALALDTPMVVLSAGSDGIDGNSPAAGAIADETTVARARAMGIDAAASLAHFNAYPLFTALGDALVTGPTHNNLRDLRILL